MGDRANIAFKQEGKKGGHIFLYGHWSGHSFPAQLQEALKFGNGRWQDGSYLARICVTRISKDLADSETGMGLSTYPTDNEHKILEVDCEKQMVRVLDDAGWHDGDGKWTAKKLAEWTFEEYIALTIPEDAAPIELSETEEGQEGNSLISNQTINKKDKSDNV